MPLDEERQRTVILQVRYEHPGEVLVYMDARENPLRYALHNGIEEAMLQAQIEYNVGPDEWDTVHERLPWKHRYYLGSRRRRS